MLTKARLREETARREHAELLLQRLRECAQRCCEDMAAARERAESDSRAKSALLATISHELRTPLNGILGFAQVLQFDAAPGTRLAGGLSIIRRSGEHLLKLVNDIVEHSRFEAGRMELNLAPLELAPCVQMVVDALHVNAELKSLRLALFLDPELPRVIQADEQRLQQVLLNLLGNATKFTAQGQVALRVHCLLDAACRPALRFEVEDTGPGIAMKDLDSIFLPFRQLGDAHQRSGGTGLGLAISRQLVQLMGSELHVQSVVGKGSRFWFDVAVN